ncbi:MAG: hypothetical protein OEY01_16030 [Desulfobulbaceae bacterium]|nr:hypothetical protein [Desulfobulbaceae bacterium]
MSKIIKTFLILLSLSIAAGLVFYKFSPIFWSQEKMLAESAKLLQQRFNDQMLIESSGWSLRKIYVTEGQLFVIMNFPRQSQGGIARSAPVFSELVRQCPVVGEDSYWDNGYAQPFTIYLSNEGKSNARSIARCSSALDRAAHDRIKEAGLLSGAEVEIYPKEDDDPQLLDAAAAEGSPSYNQAVEAMRRDDTKLLQEYLNTRPELVALYDRVGHTLLYESSSPVEVKILIGYGANLNVRQRNGPTVLGRLSEMGFASYSVVKTLINEGADATQVGPEYARTGKIARLLLDNGAPITNNSLYEALSNKNDFSVAEALYAKGARLNTTTLVPSPLHSLIDNASSKYVGGPLEEKLSRIEMALKLGADPDRRQDGLTALEYVQQQPEWNGRDEVITLLRQHKMNASR